MAVFLALIELPFVGDHTHVCSMFYLTCRNKEFFKNVSLDKEALSFSLLTFDMGKLGNTGRMPNKCERFLVESGNL